MIQRQSQRGHSAAVVLQNTSSQLFLLILIFTGATLRFLVNSTGVLQRAITQTETLVVLEKYNAYISSSVLYCNCCVYQLQDFQVQEEKSFYLCCLPTFFLEEENVFIKFINFREQDILLPNFNYWGKKKTRRKFTLYFKYFQIILSLIKKAFYR